MPKDKSEKKRKGPADDFSGDIHMEDDTTERVRRMITHLSFSATDAFSFGNLVTKKVQERQRGGYNPPRGSVPTGASFGTEKARQKASQNH